MHFSVWSYNGQHLFEAKHLLRQLNKPITNVQRSFSTNRCLLLPPSSNLLKTFSCLGTGEITSPLRWRTVTSNGCNRQMCLSGSIFNPLGRKSASQLSLLAAHTNTISARLFVSWNGPDTPQAYSPRQRRLKRLSQTETEAYANPLDVSKIVEFMKEGNRNDPESVVRFYENNFRESSKNDACLKEYIKALALTDRLQNYDMSYLSKVVSGNSESRQHFNTLDYETHRNATAQQPATHTSTDVVTDFSKSSVPIASSVAAPNQDLRFQLSNKDPVKVVMMESNKMNFWRLLRSIAWMLILVSGVSIVVEGVMQNVQKGFSVGTKKILPVEDTGTTFHDVKGCDEVKDEVQEIISYLKDPNKFTKLGAKLPKGILLSGPPGTGKTLIARAMAGEAKVPFIQASGSDFEEMFVGVGARRIRELFSAARNHSPCIVFIDELDAVGSKRSRRDNNAVRMTLNQLLVELDGFEQNEGLVVICATNFLESLDSALMRPGRLDKIITVPFPDLRGRREILNMYGEKIVLGDDVNLEVLARRTAGMTGADLFNILNIAAVKSAADEHPVVSMNALEQAYDRVVVGLERRNPMSDEEKHLTAYHESGHTLVNMHTLGTDKVHKATIMPRGNALGVTWLVPETEKYSQKLYEIEGQLDTLMGGKAAEEFIYGHPNVTAGCSSDLRSATQLARSMVTKYGMGMSDSPVPMFVDSRSETPISESYAQKVDTCVQNLLDQAYKRAYRIVDEHQAELHKLATALFEYETLSLAEIQLAIGGRGDEIGKLRETEEIQRLEKQKEKKKKK